MPMEKNQRFIPHEYFDWERAQVEERLEFVKGFKPSLPSGDALYETVDEHTVLEFNKRWNPWDRLYNDPEYAREQGLSGVPAMPGFAHRQVKPGTATDLRFDRAAYDAFYFTAIGGDLHYARRLCGGDKVIKVETGTDMRDVTQNGEEIRVFDFDKVTSIYDESGQEIDKSFIYTREGYQKFADGRPPLGYTENMSQWEAYLPEAHYTTDEDYQRMKRIWDQETIRGEEPLYWEDVEIGTEVPQTCSDGPVTYMHIVAWEPIPPEYLFTREELLDPQYTKTVYRDRYGSYLDETAVHFGGRNNVGSRMVFYNTDAAFLVARTVTNYIGNQGRISRFGWRLFPFFQEMRREKLGEDMFQKVPGMEGRYCDRHGAEGDTVIGRAVVTDKYINEKGEHCVEFALWAETLDGDIIQVCPTEAVLPSKNKT